MISRWQASALACSPSILKTAAAFATLASLAISCFATIRRMLGKTLSLRKIILSFSLASVISIVVRCDFAGEEAGMSAPNRYVSVLSKLGPLAGASSAMGTGR